MQNNYICYSNSAMKGLLILIAIFIQTIPFQSVIAQESDSLYYQKSFNYLRDSSENKIDYGFGWVGIDSDNIYHIRELISGKHFDLITQLLDSKVPATRYLAAEALIYANDHSIFVLDSTTTSLLNTLKSDKDIIPFRSGCTGQWTYSIRVLLNKKSKSVMGKWTRNWIRDSYENMRKQNR